MIRFFKKHKLKIFTAMFCAFALSLFTILSFGCKTYAYQINSDGNLVGDNLIDMSNLQVNGVTVEYVNNNITIINGNGLSFAYAQKNVNLTPNTYTFKLNYSQTLNTAYFVVRYNNQDHNFPSDNINGVIQTTFTIASVQDVSFRFFVNTSQNNNNAVTLSNVMLNIGSTAQNWEPYGVWYSEANYNDLMVRYDTLNTNINIFEGNILSQKIYINNIEQTYSDYDTLFKPLQRSLYINQDNEFRFVYQDYGENTYIRYELILINEASAPRVTGKIDLTDYAHINMYDINDSNIMDLYFNSMSGPLGDGVFEYYVQKNIKKIIIEIELDDTDEGRTNSVINFGNSYADGYLTGVNESNSYWETRYNVLNAKYNDLFNADSDLINKVNELTNSVNTLKTLNDDLQEQLSNNVGWQSLFFAMADTPIRTVSNVLGFELFGLNLFNTFIGMVTVFAIVWLLKKFI